jgi:glycosyltransferase involved in cell wall biosynthesis
MKISIVTACFNSADTIRGTLESVANQSYRNIEHIVIDGGSSDETNDIVREFSHVSKHISEKDMGIYDALNKGILVASGEYIGSLNADDVLHDNRTIDLIVKEITKDRRDIYFGDIRFVHPKNRLKTIRYYSSSKWNPDRFRWGYMPAHPSCYIRRSQFEKHGLYKTDYQIAADFEILIRFLYHDNSTYRYLPLIIVDMLPGGVSNRSFKSRFVLNQEIVKACRENGLKTNMAKLSLKYAKKIFEFLPLLKR